MGSDDAELRSTGSGPTPQPVPGTRARPGSVRADSGSVGPGLEAGCCRLLVLPACGSHLYSQGGGCVGGISTQQARENTCALREHR